MKLRSRADGLLWLVPVGLLIGNLQLAFLPWTYVANPSGLRVLSVPASPLGGRDPLQDWPVLIPSLALAEPLPDGCTGTLSTPDAVSPVPRMRFIGSVSSEHGTLYCFLDTTTCRMVLSESPELPDATLSNPDDDNLEIP